jgi:hypothetical protein
VVNVAAGLLSVAALFRITRRAGFDEYTRAVILGLTVTGPGLMLITGATFGEHASILYVLLAVEILMRESGSRGIRLREAALLGGMAFSSKYTAVFGAVGCVLLLAARTDRLEEGCTPQSGLDPVIPGAVRPACAGCRSSGECMRGRSWSWSRMPVP